MRPVIILFLTLIIIEGIRFILINRRYQNLSFVLEKRIKEIGYLRYLTSQALVKQEPINQCFPKFLNRLKEEIRWKYHSLWNIDEEQQVVKIKYTGYLPDWYMKELSEQVLIRVGDASIGRAISTRQPVTINLAKNDPRFTNVSSYGTRAEYRSLSCYPLIGKIKTIGGFCAYGEEVNMFKLHDIKFLLTCANLFASILENKLLNKHVDQKIADSSEISYT